ncbi:hypothetical protein [Dipodfec virus RodF1_53]|uniref:Uncharacterized protein n=1 Tax=Dipodfec virus RodF1_53 TaxID=2929302 RepID=A0A976N2Q6_9VIRU|nr:hypothetical protein [Dipodfec virus RodF1_53]
MFSYSDYLLQRTAREYIELLRVSVMNFCSHCLNEGNSDKAELYNVTPFTCSELLGFIERNLKEETCIVDGEVRKL